MSLTLEDLLAGPTLPAKKIYIDALEDTVEIQPVSLERFREHQEAGTDADEPKQQEVMEICIAESLSQQSGMTPEAARELNERVRVKLHPAAYDQIVEAVMETMYGKKRMARALEQATASSADHG